LQSSIPWFKDWKSWVVIFIFWVNFVSLARGAEPIRVVIEGLEGETLKNTEAALALPSGLIQEGVVNQPLRDIFESRVPEKVRQALEPLGYFRPQSKVTTEKTPEGQEVLRVAVIPGDPVRVSRVDLKLQGPGEKEKALKELMTAFPLKVGDALHQGKYENGRDALRAKALDLGYLEAKFATHLIRVHRGELRAEIELSLETGPQYRYGEVTFEGAPIYPQFFLERFLDFKPGEL
jgi:translocation and assembly module TamA